MRKITREAVDAFYGGYNMKNGNTVVKDGAMYLYGSKIAEFASLFNNDGNATINITLAGWNTNTTRERLNGLRGVHVTTKREQAYLNGEKWNGEWIDIK
jgi:hypothetical protein